MSRLRFGPYAVSHPRKFDFSGLIRTAIPGPSHFIGPTTM